MTGVCAQRHRLLIRFFVVTRRAVGGFILLCALSIFADLVNAQETSMPVKGSDIRGLGEHDPESATPIFRRPDRPYRPEWVTSDPTSHIQPPDEEPQVRINPEAPGPFRQMAIANQQGDRELATKYADQFVRYMINMTFEVRQLSQLIGEALVRQGLIDADSWVGVEQYMNRQLAAARKESAQVSPTHEMILERIDPDPQNRAEIYFFCSPTVHYCRQMGPDVERLWRVVKEDPRLKMGVYLIGDTEPEWVTTFKNYTGMTMPLSAGEEVAKAVRVKFVPSLIVRAPTTNQLYSRTGFIEFDKMYEFVRTVQGLSIEPTRVVEQVKMIPIGQVEQAIRSGKSSIWEGQTKQRKRDRRPGLSRF